MTNEKEMMLNLSIEREEILHSIKIFNMKAEAYGAEKIELTDSSVKSISKEDDRDKLRESLKSKSFRNSETAVTFLKNLGFSKLDEKLMDWVAREWMLGDIEVVIEATSYDYKLKVL